MVTSMRKAVVIGANGQLGSDLVKELRSRCTPEDTGRPSYDVVGLRHADIEVCDAPAARRVLTTLEPDVVFNLSAFHRVDDCEDLPERAFEVNAVAPSNLARVCRDVGAAFVHISTDYVFGIDQRRDTPYAETDLPGPVNVYGVSKEAGEHLVRHACDKHIIVRTTGLYGTAGSSGKGGNFVETMLRLAREGKAIRVVNDQHLAPTYTPDLAATIVDLVDGDHYGLFHVVNEGGCSWFEFASAIFALAGLAPEFTPTTSEAFPTKAERPRYSVLANRALAAVGVPSPRPWREALAHYLASRQTAAT
jgi:dTDP-4-dehydrorhamnose reductase